MNDANIPLTPAELCRKTDPALLEDGAFPVGSVNRRVDERLAELADHARRFASADAGKESTE